MLDQRHRAVITFTYQLPYNITAGTVTQLASARPFNATTGVDNNGDGSNNDRPVIDGVVVGKSAFRGTGTQDVSVFVEGRLKLRQRTRCCCGSRASTCSITPTCSAAQQTVYGDGTTPNPTFGQLVAVGTASNALPASWRTSIRRGCSSSRCGSSSRPRLHCGLVP